jgi:hypothetical protein
MNKKAFRSSCPRWSRASASFFLGRDVDGRDKPGHDGIRKWLLSVVATVISFNTALAHPSTVAHEHPHGLSLLPDLGALLLGALLVGGAVIAVRQIRKGTRP